ncbi:hypothetical protein L7F22_017552 [Adiantum nelumboides]|nr:hypothetical protein [Adiantum nelumboides]
MNGPCRSTGYRWQRSREQEDIGAPIVIPDDVAREKAELLRKLGAEIDAVRPRASSIRDMPSEPLSSSARILTPDEQAASGDVFDGGEKRSDLVVTTNAHAHRSGSETTHADDADDLETKPRGFFADQFENVSNFYAHYHGTGPEIWRQTGGMLDAFVAGAGTGGTLSGVAVYLQQQVAEANASDSDSEDGDSDSDSGIFTSWLRFGNPRSAQRRWAPSEDEVKPWEEERKESGSAGMARPARSGEAYRDCVGRPPRLRLVQQGQVRRHVQPDRGRGKRRRHQRRPLSRLFVGRQLRRSCPNGAETQAANKKGRGATGGCDDSVRLRNEAPLQVLDDDAVRKLGLDPTKNDISDILAAPAPADAPPASLRGLAVS